jgi:hypothetical protein
MFIADPTPQINTNPSHIPRFPSLSLTRTPSQSEQILSLAEWQMTSSFRRPFTPIYRQSTQSNNGFRRSFNIQRKMSIASSHHLSSVLSQRKRDSDASQNSISLLPEVQSRMSIPAVNKQYRLSVPATN